MVKINYRDLKNYKYQLTEPYSIQTNLRPAKKVNYKFISLDTKGLLTIKKSYAWDGPSGPTIDTKDFMRGSLVHDALYQLMRKKLISSSRRKYADKLLVQLCREDGMNKLRSTIVYIGVRLFAGFAANTK